MANIKGVGTYEYNQCGARRSFRPMKTCEELENTCTSGSQREDETSWLAHGRWPTNTCWKKLSYSQSAQSQDMKTDELR